ncbi:Transcription factor TFIIIB component B'' [Nymphon striatum]|nr:Transcription factor TFIIIB component B'' [Nymphon striatum]
MQNSRYTWDTATKCDQKLFLNQKLDCQRVIILLKNVPSIDNTNNISSDETNICGKSKCESLDNQLPVPISTSLDVIESEQFHNAGHCVLATDNTPEKAASISTNLSGLAKGNIISSEPKSAEFNENDKSVSPPNKKDPEYCAEKISHNISKPETNVGKGLVENGSMPEHAAKRRSKFTIKPKVSAKTAVECNDKDKPVSPPNEGEPEYCAKNVSHNTNKSEINSGEGLVGNRSMPVHAVKRRSKLSFKPSIPPKKAPNIDNNNVKSTDKSALDLKKSVENINMPMHKTPEKLKFSTAERDCESQKFANENVSPDLNKINEIRLQNVAEEGTRTRQSSGPPSIQRVLRTDDNSLKVTPNVENKNKSNDIEPDKIIESPRKRHKSATCELNDLKKRRNSYKKGKRPEKAEMRMLDFIYWNPDDNRKQKNQDVGEKRTKETVAVDHVSRRIEEEEVDNPDNQHEENNIASAPQLKVGPNGELIIDEETLVVKPVEVNTENYVEGPSVFEGTSTTTYASFKRGRNRKKWREKETYRFYRALCITGLDFSLMAQLMPGRSRDELKKKFIKEDRINKVIMDKCINSKQLFDMDLINGETDVEEEEGKGKKKEKSKRKQKTKTKRKPRKKCSDHEKEPVEVVECENSDSDPSYNCSSSNLKNIKCKKNDKRQQRTNVVSGRECEKTSEPVHTETSVNIADDEKTSEPVHTETPVNTTDDAGVKIIHYDIITSPGNILSSTEGNIMLSPQPSNGTETELIFVPSEQGFHVFFGSPNANQNNTDSANHSISENVSNVDNNSVASVEVT